MHIKFQGDSHCKRPENRIKIRENFLTCWMICWRCIIKIYKFGMDARIIVYFCCRGSWEPCGLKSGLSPEQRKTLSSRLVRALWIEISARRNKENAYDVEARESLVDWNRRQYTCNRIHFRRGSWEPCGLKFVYVFIIPLNECRGSWEPCGLKFVYVST